VTASAAVDRPCSQCRKRPRKPGLSWCQPCISAEKRTRLSPAQRRALESVRDHGDPLHHVHGAAAHGGASGTIASLRRAGAVDLGGSEEQGEWRLTAIGRRALETGRLDGRKKV
jgi:hypothetical protein